MSIASSKKLKVSIFFVGYSVLFCTNCIQISFSQPRVPCYCIFGDSLVDNGNNNNLSTMAKANHHPYGIDFPNGPTGRFTNGENIADYLGFDDFIPPFATTKEEEIKQCVNYGLAAAGILEETGSNLGDRVSLSKQLANHRTSISRLSTLFESENLAMKHLGKCLYTVGMGSNDYINNYLKPQYFPTSRIYTPDEYSKFLIHKYSQQLQQLYNLGARKIAIFGVGPIGCTPGEIDAFGKNLTGCVDSINNAIQLFNDRLKVLVEDLNVNFSSANFTYINIMKIQSGSPASIGLRFLNQPCCQVSNVTGQCIAGLQPCFFRAFYLFWDKFHPTSLVNRFTADRSYRAMLPTDVYPIDIGQLIK